MYKRILSVVGEKLSNVKEPINQLAIMQHHGLHTRVMNISTNALVALYFSLTDVDSSQQDTTQGSSDDGYVYVYTPIHKSNEEDSEKSTDIKYMDSDTVLIKSALAQMRFHDKVLLSQIPKGLVLNHDNRQCLI